ncbi:hypothetical protein SELMODRAFT_420272 [Selaginella moellendorffii]|uniref:Protein kinase domain-containing protein n=1 Tax=Selaginella moellendorffii TaxID=88036 RepID=D8SBG8_SELML|nr:hypothetical protein SELMODRAFT_420272 [Selaginella moellendorffii]
MEHLTVASNRFSGPIPGTMGNLTRLLTLSLAVNNFSGSLPQEIGNLSSLTELLVLDVGRDQNVVTWRKRTEKSFARTAAVAEPPELTKKRLSRDERVALVKSFVEKCLDSTGLGGELPPALSSLRGLQTLNMFDSNFNGSILDFLANMSSFEILAMYGNKLSGLLAASLANLTNLRELTLRNCQLSGFIPDLGNLTQLTHLHLSFNNLTGTIPAYISSFDRLSRLKSEHFQFPNLTGGLPNQLSRIVDLNATIIGNPFSVNRTQGQNANTATCLHDISNCGSVINCGGPQITLDGTDFNIDMPSSLDGDYYSTGGWVSSSSGFAESFQDNRPLISAIQVLPEFETGGTSQSENSSKGVKIGVGVSVPLVVLFVVSGYLLLKLLDGKLHMFSYNEIKNATGGFDPARLFGKGAFGKVYKGVLSDVTVVAIKQLNRVNDNTGDVVNEATLISTGIPDSFGVLVLEIVSGRTNLDTTSEDMTHLLDHVRIKIYEMYGSCTKAIGSTPGQRADNADDEQVISTQATASQRPAMSKVVAMLTGSEEVRVSSLLPGYFGVIPGCESC